MSKTRFAIRTIQKGGWVTIFGMKMRPSSQWLKYDGKLDGMRYNFGLYWSGDKLEPFAELWGTEAMHKAVDEDSFSILYDADPQAMDDGRLPWMWWGTEEHFRESEEIYKRVNAAMGEE